ncbi:glutamine--tRNA ligase/YqeY domain fusion protein [Candidatus Sumerlaeota bacterium]|nr:glutamine--tRNA ligase/YqeY domain fusion protein [Candidatus Sumerlaeota bacterium]
MTPNDAPNALPAGTDFIRTVVAEDMKTGKWGGKVVTRFPPEPNGPATLGQAKAIGIDFGIAEEFGGECHLRMDDTNPEREEEEYVEAIKEDIRWLGYDWGEHFYYASDYFDQMHRYAVELIRQGKAFVCDLSADQVREYRGTLTEPGRESPYRNRSIEENLDLFERMRLGEFENGSRTLRAKIDMASGNVNMRDPIMYRIVKVAHHRQGDKWCIYPSYDWAHGIEDSIEGITHSLCSLEFQDHRPLYDWFLDQLGVHHPRQYEFSRLNLTYTVMSTRRFRVMVEQGLVSGWDDPRLSTLRGLRRRGYTPEALRDFCRRIGVAKTDSMVDYAFLEHCLREDLNKRAPRVMAVLNPLRVVVENYPEGQVEEMEAINNPEDPEGGGTRKVSFSRVLYIERDDFMEDPPKKFFRLAPGREVRLRYAYFIQCEKAIKDENTGEIVELRCTYDPETKGGNAPDGRKVKATLHWVSADHALPAEVRLFSHLFTRENPLDVGPDEDWKDSVDPNSIETLTGCRVEPSLKNAQAEDRFQFERLGYFCVDPDSTPERLVFNRTVTLRDDWAKIQSSQKK